MVLKTQTAHNSSSCTSSACRTVTISLIIGVVLLICMTAVVIWCCKRGQRKVKNTVMGGVMGLFSRATNKALAPADDLEQLRPQQQQQPIPPPAPSYYQPSYGQSPHTQRYEDPYEAPYYPEYDQQQQTRNVGRALSKNQIQSRGESLSEKRAQQQQQRRYETIPEETPVKRRERLTRLASTVASSM